MRDHLDVVPGPDAPPSYGALTWALRCRPSWMDAAACARPEHEGVDFFPGRGEPVAPAITVCAGCPVIEECHDWATDPGQPDPLPDGIAAGLPPRRRRAIRRARQTGDPHVAT
jgi:hypothetical protein